MNAKTELITLRIPGDIKTLLEQKARALDISLNDYVKTLILEDAKKTLRETFLAPEEESNQS